LTSELRYQDVLQVRVIMNAHYVTIQTTKAGILWTVKCLLSHFHYTCDMISKIDGLLRVLLGDSRIAEDLSMDPDIVPYFSSVGQFNNRSYNYILFLTKQFIWQRDIWGDNLFFKTKWSSVLLFISFRTIYGIRRLTYVNYFYIIICNI